MQIELEILNPLNAFRYSFQGQEKDDEVVGASNSINYTYRMHDVRVGRFFAVDPLAMIYSYNSPYSFSENRVIDGIELEGLEFENLWSDYNDPGDNAIKLPDPSTAQFQSYTVTITGSAFTFEQYKYVFKNDPCGVLTNSKATFNEPTDGSGNPAAFQVGSYIEIDINGPLNNSMVKIVDMQETENSMSATFVTLEGHVEKGIIKFQITELETGDIEFSITSISEVDMILANEDYARTEQSKSWNEVIDKVANAATAEKTVIVKKVVDKKLNESESLKGNKDYQHLIKQIEKLK